MRQHIVSLSSSLRIFLSYHRKAIPQCWIFLAHNSLLNFNSEPKSGPTWRQFYCTGNICNSFFVVWNIFRIMQNMMVRKFDHNFLRQKIGLSVVNHMHPGAKFSPSISRLSLFIFGHERRKHMDGMEIKMKLFSLQRERESLQLWPRLLLKRQIGTISCKCLGCVFLPSYLIQNIMECWSFI